MLTCQQLSRDDLGQSRASAKTIVARLKKLAPKPSDQAPGAGCACHP